MAQPTVARCSSLPLIFFRRILAFGNCLAQDVLDLRVHAAQLVRRRLTSKHVAMTWARGLRRVFGIRIEQCVRCGGRLKVIPSSGTNGREH
jgi:hypothetical protein